ncbi:hypothetical protein GGX14DRAFT_407098 [Mycena pura]|uniref:Uncharacterized protein n=1 Tax=Mycena pura TaxID=153505 RepID=A0AAD6UNR3_9AGAR|nr:hypothetical protein GGX14DRAFT_407098 [Mycena pura]
MSWSCFEGAALPSQVARRIRRPISESAADVAAQSRWLGRSAGPYQNPRLMLLPSNVQITNQFGTIRRPISESVANVAAQTRSQGGSAGPYQNPWLMLLPRNVQITNQFGTVNLVVWADLCHSSQIARRIRRPISESVADVAAQKCPNYEPIWHGEISCPARLGLKQPDGWITNQFGTMARRIRRPISESAADVAAQIRWLGGSAGPYQNSRLMLLLRNVQITNQFGMMARRIRRAYQNPRLMLLLRNVQITNQFGTVNLVVWADLCHSSQIARKIRRPISESAADVAAQIVWADLCHSSQIARRIRRPISESAADVAAQTRSQGRSAGPYQNPRLMLLLRLSGLTCAKPAPTSQMARRIRRAYQNPRLMLLLRNVQITNQFGTVNLVVWADLCHSSQIARKIRRPISESAADVAAQTRLQGGSAGPYQNPRPMLLLRNIQITNQFGTVNLVVWADLCHSSQIARKIRRPISESAADVAAQIRWLGRSAGPYQNLRLMLLLRNVQITNQFGTMARRIRRPISESAADVAAQKCPNYEPIWHVRWLGGSAGPYQNPRLMLLLRLSGLTCAKPAPTSQMARKIRRPISESAADVAAQIRWLGGSAGPYQNPRLMLLLRLSGLTCAKPAPTSQMARKIRRPISESAADVAAQKYKDMGSSGHKAVFASNIWAIHIWNNVVVSQLGLICLPVWAILLIFCIYNSKKGY